MVDYTAKVVSKPLAPGGGERDCVVPRAARFLRRSDVNDPLLLAYAYPRLCAAGAAAIKGYAAVSGDRARRSKMPKAAESRLARRVEASHIIGKTDRNSDVAIHADSDSGNSRHRTCDLWVHGAQFRF